MNGKTGASITLTAADVGAVATSAVGTAAAANIGTASGTVAAGDDIRLNTPFLECVTDGATDQYAVLMAALARAGTVSLPPNLGGGGYLGVATAKPLLLAAGQGIRCPANVGGAKATFSNPAIMPAAGFSAALTTAQQSAYPALGATANALIVCAGTGAFVVEIQMTNLANGSSVGSCILFGADGPIVRQATLQGGSAASLDCITSGVNQATITDIYVGGNTGAWNMRAYGNDWSVSKCRFVTGSKLLSVNDFISIGNHWTGSSTAASGVANGNIQLVKRAQFLGDYFDSSNWGADETGQPYALIYNAATVQATSTATGCRYMQNNTYGSGAGSPEKCAAYYNASATSGLQVIGGWAGIGSGAFPYFWDSVNGFDSVDGLSFKTAQVPVLTHSGTPGRIGALTVDGTCQSPVPLTSGAPAAPLAGLPNNQGYDDTTGYWWVVSATHSRHIALA